MRRIHNCLLGAILAAALWTLPQSLWGQATAETLLGKNPPRRGVAALVELPSKDPTALIELCESTELLVFFQTVDQELAGRSRQLAEDAGLLGTRLFIEFGSRDQIQLGDNVADRLVIAPGSEDRFAPDERLRPVRPRGLVLAGGKTIVKPVPEGVDDWTHPYHGPDNNPQSDDQHVRGELRTQFIGFPKFSPMPEQTVIAGGRIYKAMGHIAHKANQNEMLNTLLCINAYNGVVLWRRPLSPGFMLHRNTMIATDDALYMGDHESCKVMDGETGEVRDEFKVGKDISDGPVWKWMAMRDGVLYALVGNPEVKIETQKAIRRGLGHWPWGMWDGHDYDDPRTSFGFGRTLVAIDLKSKQRLWHFREQEFLDARGVCMNKENIYCYCPGKFLAAVDLRSGKLAWKNTDKRLLDAIGDNQKAQHYITGYATTCYMKCTDEHIFFAGPQRQQTAAVSAKDGSLQWTHPIGNLQLVLRDDAVWAAGPQQSESGLKLDYGSGKVLATFPARRACTRATGCVDSIFYRAHGGTVRVMTESNQAQHLDPMRPPCQDGVLVAGGHLYWGPWMCGCQLSLYGNIGLRPMGSSPVDASPAVWTPDRGRESVERLEVRTGDWPTYRGGNARDDVASGTLPADVEFAWKAKVSDGVLPTGPVAAGGLVFVADRRGTVQARDVEGELVWKAHSGGPIYYPPTIAHDRVYVGSADGRVYAFSARDGRLQWTHRVGPDARRLVIYDRLVSAWPVAGGVVVEGNRVYAAAGIAHYDGTHVVALDAITGELQAANRTSGALDQLVNNGVSMQGNLTIVDGELRFLAGGVYEWARYDLETLECLNEPKSQVSSQYRTAFYPYYPEYGKYVSLDYACKDGCFLTHDASYEGSQFVNLARQPALAPGQQRPTKEAARWMGRRGNLPPNLWQDRENRRFTSFVVTERSLLATGHVADREDAPFLVSIDPADGSDRWRKALPSLPVKGGVAIDADRNVFIMMENGELSCYR